MALKTLGSTLTTSLSATAFGYGTVTPADWATLMQSIKDDQVITHPQISALDQAGVLKLPNRMGFIQLLVGDWIGVDSRGWPILLSADTIANGPWTHT